MCEGVISGTGSRRRKTNGYDRGLWAVALVWRRRWPTTGSTSTRHDWSLLAAGPQG